MLNENIFKIFDLPNGSGKLQITNIEPYTMKEGIVVKYKVTFDVWSDNNKRSFDRVANTHPRKKNIFYFVYNNEKYWFLPEIE